jgi:hypothetical protein
VLNEVPAKPQLLKLLLVIILFLALILYVIPSVLHGDFLWFTAGIDGTPSSVTVYRYGVAKTLHPGDNGFDKIVAVTKSELPKVNAMGPGGVGADTITDVRQKHLAVELQYDKQITIHVNFSLGNPDDILIPLDGWESNDHIYYLASKQIGQEVFGAWRPVLPVDSFNLIKSTVESLGY